MTESTIFDLASVTKVMATTFALMLLVDRGQVDIDATVSTYLPDFVNDGRERITVRHLLTHRAGVPQWVPTYYHAEDPDAAYAYIRSLPLSWPVGEERHYSDLGFMLLGRIVEEVSGRPLDDFTRTEIYDALGLESTGFRAVPGRDPGSSWADAPETATGGLVRERSPERLSGIRLSAGWSMTRTSDTESTETQRRGPAGEVIG